MNSLKLPAIRHFILSCLDRNLFLNIQKAIEEENISVIDNYLKSGLIIDTFIPSEGLMPHLTLLQYACKFNKEEVVNYLIEKGADINLRHSNNETALYISLQYKQLPLKLLRAGADPFIRHHNDSTISKAIRFKINDVIDFVIQNTSSQNELKKLEQISKLYGNPLADKIRTIETKLYIEKSLTQKSKFSSIKRKI